MATHSDTSGSGRRGSPPGERCERRPGERAPGKQAPGDAGTVESAGRPRDTRIDAAVRDAAAELLLEVGYPKVTMTAIAERAGTTKTALYRRWSGKAELLHAVAFSAMTTMPTAPTDIVTDLRTMIEAVRDLFADPITRAALPGLIADTSADPALAARVHAEFAEVFAVVRDRLVVAVERGEVHADVDPERLIEMLGGAAMLRMLLLPDARFDESWVEQMTAIVMHGVVMR